MPGMAIAPDHALTSLVKQLTGANSAGKVSYGTESGYYQAAGHPHHHLWPRPHRPGAPAG